MPPKAPAPHPRHPHNLCATLLEKKDFADAIISEGDFYTHTKWRQSLERCGHKPMNASIRQKLAEARKEFSPRASTASRALRTP